MSKYLISARTFNEDGEGCVDVHAEGEQWHVHTEGFKCAKSKRAAMKRAKAWVTHRESFELVRANTVIWHPPVKCSDALLRTVYGKVCGWHGMQEVQIDQGAITALSWPRSESGCSSLHAYLEGLNDALRACAL